jgi:hypothetical protein
MVNKTFVHPAICKGNIQEKKNTKNQKTTQKDRDVWTILLLEIWPARICLDLTIVLICKVIQGILW